MIDLNTILDNWKQITGGVLLLGLTGSAFLKTGELSTLWSKVTKRTPVKATVDPIDDRFGTAHKIVDLMGTLQSDTVAVQMLNDLLRHVTEEKTQ